MLAGSTANFQIEIFYAKETHQVDTSQPFTETLSNPNGSSFDIDLPADVLTSNDEVDLTMYSTPKGSVTPTKPLPSEKSGADIFYNVSFTKVSDGSTVSSFDEAITLTFNYSDSDIGEIDESTLTAYRWNGSAWTALSDSTVDTDLNKVTASSQNFSDFALLGDPSSTCNNGVVESGEQCDGAALNGQTCQNRGYTGGTLSCNANCTFNVSACTSENTGGGSGGGSGSAYVAPVTSAVFSGRAYPKSSVTLLKDAQIAATTVADANANFSIRLSNLSGGNYFFSLYSEDNKGNRSSLLTFPISVTSGATTNIDDIFIAPTVATDKSEVKHGDNIAIFGQSTPNSEITISVNSEKEFFNKVTSDKNGAYLYNFDTTSLEKGQHFTKSKTALDGNISSFSKTIAFTVGTKTILSQPDKELGKSDINFDNKVNLVDFSIAAYWYKRPSPPTKADLNNDGKVDLIDLSIMAFYWTG